MVDAHGEALSGVLDADGMLASGQPDQAGGVDGAVDFDRVAGLASRDRWRTGWTAVLVEQSL